MAGSFVLRATERGYSKLLSTGPNASYVAGHPDALITRYSSFNFHEYQSGRPGFGRIRVFGDEVFSGAGCGYNMHPHHNFLICAFVLRGRLTHLNTMGKIDELVPGDYYLASFGSGGKHCELNLETEDMNAIYLWILPNRLMLPPSYSRSHFDTTMRRNRIETLIGEMPDALSIPQDVRVSRLVSDRSGIYEYIPTSPANGIYAFVVVGEVSCSNTQLGSRDSLGIWDVGQLALQTGTKLTDVFFVETVM
jgi:quercetin 2,3-dioxygenase